MDTRRQPVVNTFAGLSRSLDRMAERRDDAAWIARQAQAADTRYLLLDSAGKAFLHADRDALIWLEQCPLPPDSGSSPSLLGLIDGQALFMQVIEDEAQAARIELDQQARRMDLRAAALQLSGSEAGLFAYAKGLSHWQRETRHCAYCGTTLQLVAAGHRAQCANPDCGRLHFPRTDAAVIMLVEHDGACLLGRQASWPPGRYSTLAGFVEPGESLEDAVRREVVEEAGVIVDDVHYHSSQPWPMPASLMVGFIATATGRAIHRRDGELEDARWFTPQAIVDGLADGSFLPSIPLSVSYQLLASWLRQRAGLELDALVARAR